MTRLTPGSMPMTQEEWNRKYAVRQEVQKMLGTLFAKRSWTSRGHCFGMGSAFLDLTTKGQINVCDGKTPGGSRIVKNGEERGLCPVRQECLEDAIERAMRFGTIEIFENDTVCGGLRPAAIRSTYRHRHAAGLLPKVEKAPRVDPTEDRQVEPDAKKRKKRKKIDALLEEVKVELRPRRPQSADDEETEVLPDAYPESVRHDPNW